MEAAMGRALLGACEEMSLEELLNDLRVTLDPVGNITYPRSTSSNHNKLKTTHVEDLDQLAARHFRDTQSAALSLSGRALPLLYKLISALVSPPHTMTLLVLDLDGRFDATSLTCESDNLHHVYVQRPARSSPEHLRALIAEADDFMLYGGAAQASVARPWWGTIVIGGLGAGDIMAGWKGWLRVDRENVQSFAFGMSAEEALAQRDRRQAAVDGAGWVASSQWGNFVFHDE